MFNTPASPIRLPVSTEVDDTSENEDHATLEASLELPSCLESLSSSSEQLQELANHLGQCCVKWLLCYGYAADLSDVSRAMPTLSPSSVDDKKFPPLSMKQRAKLELNVLSKDQTRLESLEAAVEALPYLNELCTVMDRCFLTIESTLKRFTYHMNKASERAANRVANMSLGSQAEFQLTTDARLDSIFVGLMDVAFAIVSLDKTIQLHTPGICSSLNSLMATCELVFRTVGPKQSADDGEARTLIGGQDYSYDDDDVLSKFSGAKIENLLNYVRNIQLTLCNPSRSLFQQCLERLQHLSLHLSSNRTSKGYEILCKHFDEFMELYGEHFIDSNHVHDGHLLTPEQATQAYSLNQLKSRSIMLINSNIIPTKYMTSPSRRLFGLSSIFILYNWLFKKPNKHLARSIMQTLQKFKLMNLTHLVGSNCYILLNEFLAKHLPKSLLDMRVLKQLSDSSGQLLKINTIDEFERHTLRLLPWLVKFRAEVKCQRRANESSFDIHSRQFHLIIQGLRLADEINHSIKSFITIYLHHNKPMAKNQLVPLFRMVTLLKSIEECLICDQLFVNQCLINLEYFVGTSWQQLMTKARKRLISLRFSERKIDTDSLLQLISICSGSSFQMATHQGRTIISLSLPMLITTLNNDELSSLNRLMSFIYPFPLPDERLKDVANCGYLYWSWPTLSTYYNYTLEEDPCASNELHYLHMAINDIPSLFRVDKFDNSHQELGNLIRSREEFLKKLALELMNQFKADFLDKLCQELEIELRLQTHRELHLDGHNPFRRHLYNFKMIFSSHHNTFRIFDQQVSMRQYVEQHLNRICYNLTAIAPHDWFTYDSMINLTKIRYDLNLANTQLPTQSLDSGLDLLDITRHLALFVFRHGYDLTNQLFIEKCSYRTSSSSAAPSVFSGGASHGMLSMLSTTRSSSSVNPNLNVIQIKHIAKSIQTHGYGVLNSSVNCTYQMIKRLVNLFAKQMADDKLRATLTKEQLAISSGRQAGVSFDKATRMAKKFKLSVTSQSVNETPGQQPVGIDLDSLRQSITQLGNLLGFIRMLKSGALSCASRSADYLPDLDNFSIGLSKLVRGEFEDTNSQCFESSYSLYKASENFDQCLTDLEENFSPKTNYFGIVIDLFQNSLVGSNTDNEKKEEEETENKIDRIEVDIEQSKPKEADNLKEFERTNTICCSTPETRSPECENTGNDLNGKKPGRKRDTKRDCLSLFFVLIPALTINYIDYIIICKERAMSRSSATRFGALISDDGFPMGVAFLLTVLGQGQSFAKLEWFKEIEAKLVVDKQEVEQRVQDSSYEESLRQTSSMTLRRLNRLRLEYNGLRFTLSSALLFFRSSAFARGE